MRKLSSVMLPPHNIRAATRQVDLADTPCVNGKRCSLELFSLRWLKLQRTVRSRPVVMANGLQPIGNGMDS